MHSSSSSSVRGHSSPGAALPERRRTTTTAGAVVCSAPGGSGSKAGSLLRGARTLRQHVSPHAHKQQHLGASHLARRRRNQQIGVARERVEAVTATEKDARLDAEPSTSEDPSESSPSSSSSQAAQQRDWAAKDASHMPSFAHGRPVTVLTKPPEAPSSSDNMFSGSAGKYEPQEHHLSGNEIWKLIREEAAKDSHEEPSLASSLHSTILNHNSLAKTMAFLLANKLASPTVLGTSLMQIFIEAYESDESLMEACVADMNAVFDRDPACDKYTHCMLNFKGFQAVQAQRISHWLWKKDRTPMAYLLQSRISERFHVDIHPAAKIGMGIMIDHASGVVIGETAVVGDNVSILHHVTLGGSGIKNGVRHPQIGNGVLLGAGVSCVGPIKIGNGSKVGAGSLVVTDLEDYSVAVGVPAKQLRRKQGVDPNKSMDQTEYIYDYII